jgi:glutamyl-tRNA synthetase
LQQFAQAIQSCDWQPEPIAALIKQTVADSGVKMPQFGVPIRVLVFGRAQTPALEQVLSQLPRDAVLARLQAGLPVLEHWLDQQAAKDSTAGSSS